MLFSKRLFGPLVPSDLSSDHQALPDYFGSTLPGEGNFLKPENLGFRYLIPRTRACDSPVQQQYRPDEVVVELLWEAENHEERDGGQEIIFIPDNVVHHSVDESCPEDMDFTEVFEVLYCDSVRAVSSTNTKLDHNKYDDDHESVIDEPCCKSFPLAVVRNRAHIEFEVSTELNDEFFSRRNPGKRVDHLPIVYLNLRRTMEGSL
ncbi:uncharacterized protein EKO05_0007015 [Ascochyta rabiei]|uniref:uncharacterized protein n=1 Tax=Didymella rabiei TaxID=5454 RepID=UPI0021FC041C|nr:uncharacterized protein EKO05_0007015 [Ascochyta rabiei]UPX16625.1 hypothetical protein EKO05_0007015 [Ascochyta rabiei]